MSLHSRSCIFKIGRMLRMHELQESVHDLPAFRRRARDEWLYLRNSPMDREAPAELFHRIQV